VNQAKARTPLIATALVALIGLFWFLSIPKLGNTGFQKFAETKQRESARANATVTEVESGPDHPESPVRRDREFATKTIEDATGLPAPSNVGIDQAAAGPDSSDVLAPPPAETPSLTPLELVWIRPGTFMMGSPDDENGRRSNESPQTVVTISYGFWLGKYEITFAHYRMISGRAVPWISIGGAPWSSIVRSDEDENRPVIALSWKQAVDFCARFTEQERTARRLPKGFVYRLPTEAEWEYACRADSTTRFSYGDDLVDSQLDTHVWYSANSDDKPRPVGTKHPNPWGLHDMHGNASEWCLDNLGRYSGGSVTNPIGFISGRSHIQRGGSYHAPHSAHCRSAFRQAFDTGDKSVIANMEVGFRVALAPELISP
jgi:formylglycine-generating enzyme required for sulfatase activity